jgi:predicted TIM-barrel fold metal-dependent hydrolase
MVPPPENRPQIYISLPVRRRTDVRDSDGRIIYPVLHPEYADRREESRMAGRPDSRIDPDGKRLPIKLDSTSNGEFAPVPLSPGNHAANQLAHEAASVFSKKLSLGRRSFLTSACGAASTLLAFNAANAAAGRSGGFFDIRREAALDEQLARAQVGPAKDEFIFDVQGHFVDTPKQNPKGPEVFIKDVFLDSDTDLMVLSFVPSTREAEPVTIQAADAVRRIVERLQGTHRLLLHGRVQPNQPGDLESMDELKEKWRVSAWKTYTQFGPGGVGYFLSDEPGMRLIQKARALGVKTICVHKGLPFGQKSYEHSQCSDIGVVAKHFPDVNFLVYHSGFVTGVQEQPYDPAAGRDGIDTLIRSLLKNEVKPGSNVYAELGSTWRFLMRDPEQAAHALGKLLLHCGESNVLWGTDSIWYGSPQDQIQAFRAFQIAPALREKHGYPEITPQLRAKIFGLSAAKVYGLSAAEVKKYTARDSISGERLAYAEHPEPSYLTYGPKTRREFLDLLRNGAP